MAIASTRTLIPLDRFARVFGIHPLHFNQVTINDLAPATTCGQPLVQYAWQTAAAVSREDIAIALAEAEDTVARELGYYPLSKWQRNEMVRMPTPRIPELYSFAPVDVRWQWSQFNARFGYIITGGIRATTLIEANAAIVYTDPDGDGYDELATITVTTTVTAEDEIHLFYPDHAGEEEWEIRPINVRIASGTATITCRREQLVKEIFLEAINARAVDGLTDSNFLDEVDVYRVYNDPSTQAEFQWAAIANSCNCDENECASCTYAVQNACLSVRDTRVGLFSASPGDWDADNNSYDRVALAVGRSPDRVKINYYAGYTDQNKRNPNIDMDTSWETVISRFAVTLLNRQICACQNVVAATQMWREDMAHNVTSPSQASSYRIPQNLFNNPIGTTLGALNLWRKIVRERLGEGVVNA